MEGILVLAWDEEGTKSYHCAESYDIAVSNAREAASWDGHIIVAERPATHAEVVEFNAAMDAWMSAKHTAECMDDACMGCE